MRAPSKAQQIQSVGIRRTQRLAASVELNPVHREVTNDVKPGERMNQAATQVNVLSLVIFNIVGVDGLHFYGRQNQQNYYWQGLVPALNSRAAHVVSDRQMFLSQSAVMQMKHILTKLLCRTTTWQYPRNTDHKISTAPRATHLGGSNIKNHKLSTPLRMF
jgi:hypothetical protein